MTTAIAHTMLRVADLERALAFYVRTLGMEVVRREDYPSGEFTLAFVGYDGPSGVTLELTHNWGRDGPYAHGSGFGHVALVVDDLAALCERVLAAGFEMSRPPAPMAHLPSSGRATEHIAFVRDPDGYAIELIQR